MRKIDWSKVYGADTGETPPATDNYLPKGNGAKAHHQKEIMRRTLIEHGALEEPTDACKFCIYFLAANSLQADIDLEDELGKPGYIRDLKAKIQQSERDQQLLEYEKSRLQMEESKLRQELNRAWVKRDE